MNSFDSNDVETVRIYQFADTVLGISLEIRRILVFWLHEWDTKIETPAGFADACELIHYLMRVAHMFHDSIANYRIEKSAWFRDLVQGRIDMDVCVVQALGNILVEKCTNDQVAYVAISRASVEDVASEEFFIGSKFLLDRGEDLSNRHRWIKSVVKRLREFLPGRRPSWSRLCELLGSQLVEISTVLMHRSTPRCSR